MTTRSTTVPPRAAIYARVSTLEQSAENQLTELRRYVELRGWTAREYVDEGVSGAKDRRPALDALLRDARRRRFDVLVCWRLDRLGRNLRHLILLLEDIEPWGWPSCPSPRGSTPRRPLTGFKCYVPAPNMWRDLV